MSEIEIVEARTPAEIADVRRLLHAFVAWQRVRYSTELIFIDTYFASAEYTAEIAALPGDYGGERGRLLLARYKGRSAGCVALRDLGDGVCEMKRMFIDANCHGRGIGHALGVAIIEAGKQIGYSTMRLDTGYRQVEAQRLYHRLGFKDIGPYYPVTDVLARLLVFMERDLRPEAARPAI